MSMSSSPFRYDMVILDVGGTMLGFHERAPFQEFLAAAGLPAGDGEARDLHRRFVSVIVSQRDSAQGLGAGEEPLFGWWQDIFVRTWPDRADLAEEMYRWFRASRFDRTFDDTLPALRALRALGMRLGVVSNFGLNLEALLHHWKLLEFFEFVVISAAVGVAKPDPAIFDHAVAAAGVTRDRLLYVGDHYGDDVMGARAAGLDAVLIDRANRHADLPCPRISSLLELPRYVEPPPAGRRGIAFDLDGVIVDSIPTHLRTWQETLAPLGITIRGEDFYPLEGMPTEPTAALFVERFLGRPCSEEESRRLAETKRALYLREFEPALMPGMGPLLHDLHGRGHRLALVTGGSAPVVEQVLGPLGVLGLFDALVTGDRVERGKPDPEPYRAAADRLELSPAECLAVENAPLGIRSARAAGLACVALASNLPAEELAGAEPVFADVAALRAWLLASQT